MRVIKLYESFKDYRAELDKLHQELDNKKKKYVENILSDLAECMHDLTDYWECEINKQVETKEIIIYYTFKLSLSQFSKFAENLKSSIDIIIEKLEPTKIKISELNSEDGRRTLSFGGDFDLIYSSSIPASERISNWSNYYNDLIDCILDKKDVKDIKYDEWRDYIEKKIPIYKRIEIKDDKFEAYLRIII